MFFQRKSDSEIINDIPIAADKTKASKVPKPPSTTTSAKQSSSFHEGALSAESQADEALDKVYKAKRDLISQIENVDALITAEQDSRTIVEKSNPNGKNRTNKLNKIQQNLKGYMKDRSALGDSYKMLCGVEYDVEEYDVEECDSA